MNIHIKFLQNPNDMAGDKSRDVYPCFHNGPLWVCRREQILFLLEKNNFISWSPGRFRNKFLGKNRLLK